MRVAKPANASSTELSTTSYTRWCRPISPVDPMYIAGRRRTASRPSSTLMLLESYTSPAPVFTSFAIFPCCAGFHACAQCFSNSHRHDDIPVLVRHSVACRTHFPRALLIFELECYVILWYSAQKIKQVLRVKPDLEVRPLIL